MNNSQHNASSSSRTIPITSSSLWSGLAFANTVHNYNAIRNYDAVRNYNTIRICDAVRNYENIRSCNANRSYDKLGFYSVAAPLRGRRETVCGRTEMKETVRSRARDFDREDGDGEDEGDGARPAAGLEGEDGDRENRDFEISFWFWGNWVLEDWVLH